MIPAKPKINSNIGEADIDKFLNGGESDQSVTTVKVATENEVNINEAKDEAISVYKDLHKRKNSSSRYYNLKLPKELHTKTKLAAFKRGMPLRDYILQAIYHENMREDET